VARYLELVGCGHLADRYPHELSGGQQQRIALARALVYEPALLLLDEPLSNLDAKLREQMRFELRALQRKLGLTLLYVTHDQTEAMTLSDRIAVINRGRFEQVGTPEEVYEKPLTSFVGDFLGRTIALEGTLRKTPAGKWIELSEGARIGINSRRLDSLCDGAVVRVSARPEDIEILPAAELGPNQIDAIVEHLDYLGDRFEYHVRAAGTLLVLSAPKKHRYAPGSKVRLTFEPDRLSVEPR
jgi:ABC-type Fe3+/spermidine/putrescine transport system ATPase subunit